LWQKGDLIRGSLNILVVTWYTSGNNRFWPVNKTFFGEKQKGPGEVVSTNKKYQEPKLIWAAFRSWRSTHSHA
jgi:hypothetical protein